MMTLKSLRRILQLLQLPGLARLLSVSDSEHCIETQRALPHIMDSIVTPRNKPTTSVASKLPQELIDAIIDTGKDNKRFLTTCSLVRRAWVPASRRHLFKRVNLYYHTVAEFDCLVQSELGTITRHIRHLAIIFDLQLGHYSLTAILFLLRQIGSSIREVLFDICQVDRWDDDESNLICHLRKVDVGKLDQFFSQPQFPNLQAVKFRLHQHHDYYEVKTAKDMIEWRMPGSLSRGILSIQNDTTHRIPIPLYSYELEISRPAWPKPKRKSSRARRSELGKRVVWPQWVPYGTKNHNISHDMILYFLKSGSAC